MPVEIECVICGGAGCDQCLHGRFAVMKCPSAYVGHQLTDDINIVAACGEGVLPVAGGLLDQPAYYHELNRTLKREVHQIEVEQSERRKRRG